MRKTVITSFILGLTLHAIGGNHLTYPAGNASRFIQSASLQGKSGFDKVRRTPVQTPVNDDTLSMSWGYSEDPGNASPLAFGFIKQAICMPSTLAADFAGSEVRSLTVGNPIDYLKYAQTYQMVNPVSEATIWISEALDGEPVASATGQLSTQGLGWSTIEFDTPYTISGDKDLYFGYSYTIEEGNAESWSNNTVWGFVTDFDVPSNENSNFLYSLFTGVTEDGMYPIFSEEPQWMNMSELMNSNACVRAEIYGDNIPIDIVDILQFDMPRWTTTDKEFEITAQIRNKGGNSINKVNMTLALAGQPIQTYEVDIVTDYDYYGNPILGKLNYNDVGIVSAKFKSTEDGNFGYTFTVSPTGAENHGDNFEISNTLLSLTDGFHKNNVVEEGTGTWCGWCVLGIAGMKYMHENYADRGFIGIALHIDDPMEILRPGNVYDFTFDNYNFFPSSYMNRNYWRETEPLPEELEYEFLLAEDTPAVANIQATLSGNSDEKKVKLSADIEFCMNIESADYGVAYTVVENNVGPYVQQNYCAGSSYDYYGYEDEPYQISMTFNEVARNCSHPQPIDNSLPNVVTKGEKYLFSTDIELYDVENLEDYSVIAMVINRETGLIENACIVESPITGINNAISESRETPIAYVENGIIKYIGNNTATIYTIDGHIAGVLSCRESMQLPQGIYMIVDHNRSCKLLVK
ncbi:MAG: hypothetical protein HDR88_13235 [Bacteroides sp.]|nr:hypothetical protein [Bacteroides sp.]